MTWGTGLAGDGWGVIAFDTRFGVPNWPGDESTGSKIDQFGDVWFGWAGAGSRNGHTIESSLNISLKMTLLTVRAFYGYIDTMHALAQQSMAEHPDGPVLLAATFVAHAKALMLFTRPEPVVVRMVAPYALTIAAPGQLLGVPYSYEERKPPGETWQQGRLAALTSLYQPGRANFPLEAVTIHDGVVTRDWLASERDLHLLTRESA